MFFRIITDYVLPCLFCVFIVLFVVLFILCLDDYFSVTVYHPNGTVEKFDSIECPTTKKAFKLKDGTYYDLPDGVKYKYEVIY